MKRAISILLASFGAFLVGYSFYGCAEKFGTEVQSAYWMPRGASDGAFYRGETAVIIGPPYYHYEFTITESDFRTLLDGRGKNGQEITEPVYVRRYLDRFIREEDFRKDGKIDYESYDEATGVRITNGLVWSYQIEDQSYTWAFDRSISRAYFELNFR